MARTLRNPRTTGAVMMLCASAALILAPGCIPTKGDIEALQAEVARLQQQQSVMSGRMDVMEKKIAEDSEARKKSEQEVLDRVARMGLAQDAAQSELQKLSGQMEELGHTVEGQGGADVKSLPEMSRDLGSLENRLGRVESFLGLAESPAAPAAPNAPQAPTAQAPNAPLAPSVPLPPAAPKPEPTVGMPQEEGPAYQFAKEALDRGELSAARERFTEFMKRFPKSKYADNSLFWIGETYFLEKDYQKAILEYQKVIEQFPKANKVPAALLKQGLAFARLKDSTNAKIILDDLISRYPQSPEAMVAKKQLNRL